MIRLHPFPRVLLLYYKPHFFFKVPTLFDNFLGHLGESRRIYAKLQEAQDYVPKDTQEKKKKNLLTGTILFKGP